MYSIENEHLHVVVASRGAELQSVINKAFGIEYMWSGDPVYWGKKSPVLFPVVGGLKNNQYTLNGQTYTLGRHGFARDREFLCTAQSESVVTFTLLADEQSLQVYPFPFRFLVTYTLAGNMLHVTYTVENTGDNNMYFSVGAHPAFRVPLVEGTSFDDYYLLFDAIEDTGRWPLSTEGLIKRHTVPVLHQANRLPLTKALFYEDALVFKHLRSSSIAIRSDLTPHGLTVAFPGFPYMGIWNAKDADFVCIEPWCGIADHTDVSGVLQEKEGINLLEPGNVFERTWSVTFY